MSEGLPVVEPVDGSDGCRMSEGLPFVGLVSETAPTGVGWGVTLSRETARAREGREDCTGDFFNSTAAAPKFGLFMPDEGAAAAAGAGGGV